MTETLFKSPCLSLSNPAADQDITLKMSKYYAWRHAKMWDAKVEVTGSSQTQTFFEFEDRTETTTLTCETETILTRNDGRQNESVVLNQDGTTSKVPVTNFNSAGRYGKIPDENLIRLRHEPCFDCSFTAFVRLSKNWTNYLILMDEGDPAPDMPFGWSSWSYSVEQINVDENTVKDLYHVNGVENVLWQLVLKVESGQINPVTFQVNPKYAIDGPVLLGTGSGQPAQIHLDGFVKEARCNLSPGLTTNVFWETNSDRPI